MSAISFQNKIMLQSNYGVVLCRSRTENGEPFFHYVMANKKGIEQMHRDYQSGKNVDFSSYGEIVLSGWGETPTPEYDSDTQRDIPTSSLGGKFLNELAGRIVDIMLNYQ